MNKEVTRKGEVKYIYKYPSTFSQNDDPMMIIMQRKSSLYTLITAYFGHHLSKISLMCLIQAFSLGILTPYHVSTPFNNNIPPYYRRYTISLLFSSYQIKIVVNNRSIIFQGRQVLAVD